MADWSIGANPRQRLAIVSLARGNVAQIFERRTRPRETGLAGWGARIRTQEWRNQNPLYPERAGLTTPLPA
jgi:hypothetical protein